MKFHRVMRGVLGLVLGLAAMAMLPACKQYAKAEFEVRVTNRTPLPLSVGFIKDGPPMERGWLAPHEMALRGAGGGQWGQVVRPGESATLGPVRGAFDEGVSAILRVYGGAGTLDDLMGFGHGDPLRVDLYLNPGFASYVIDQEQGRLLPSRTSSSAPAGQGR